MSSEDGTPQTPGWIYQNTARSQELLYDDLEINVLLAQGGSHSLAKKRQSLMRRDNDRTVWHLAGSSTETIEAPNAAKLETILPIR